MRGPVLLLFLSVIFASCSPTEPTPGIDVSTNKDRYEVNEGFNLKVVNLSQSSAWLPTPCAGRLRYDLERRVGWHWDTWLPVNECPALGLAQPRALHPARVVWETGFWTIPPGRYRIRVPFGFDSADLASNEVYSREFLVE